MLLPLMVLNPRAYYSRSAESEDYYTIDGLFKVIEEALDSDPSRVSVGFDSVFGFPTSAL
ncbi:MAG: hypothetical protein CM1200mP39_21010 [Dehalococcoidia bacterium]|nr:MAG: hypothetical protein CM1200mP39_21010 [Dehalococcoidia bacterium]